MTAETCARLILRSAARRERELIPSARGKLGLWLKLLAPSLIDRIARKAIEEGR
jgi:short-subunit dehydrogenase